MKIYFLADIFLGDQCGIYRYSYEIASAFLKDKNIDLKFVSNGSSNIRALKSKVEELFGNRSLFVDTGYIFGRQYTLDSRLKDKFIYYKEKHAKLQKYFFKILREIFRVITKLEALLIALFFSQKIDENSILFSPYHSFNQPNAKSRKFLKVIVVHDIIPILYPELFPNKKFKKEIFDKLVDFDLIITVSENTKKDLLKYNKQIDPDIIQAVHISASKKYKPIEDSKKIEEVKLKYGIPADSNYLLTVCTIEPRKNHVRLTKAWEQVYSKLNIHKPKLVIVGKKGWGEEYQKELSISSAHLESLIFTGFVEDDDLPVLYSGSIFSIYPSCYEGFGLPILESIKCGAFCLTSNTSSMPEVTGNRVPLVNPYSIDDIAEKMLSLINDRKLLDELSEKQYERSKLFSWDKTYEKTIKELENGLLKKFESN